MKCMVALMIALMIPTAAIAAGECRQDREKFCKEVVDAKGDVAACMRQHAAELSEACKAKREALEKH